MSFVTCNNLCLSSGETFFCVPNAAKLKFSTTLNIILKDELRDCYTGCSDRVVWAVKTTVLYAVLHVSVVGLCLDFSLFNQMKWLGHTHCPFYEKLCTKYENFIWFLLVLSSTCDSAIAISIKLYMKCVHISKILQHSIRTDALHSFKIQMYYWK